MTAGDKKRPKKARAAKAGAEKAAPVKAEPQAPRAPAGTTLGTKLSASGGIIAAMVLAVLVNVYVARHYRRWDWTRGGLYTLSDATVQTLEGLGEPVKITVLLPSRDPLTLSVEHLLDEYRAHTSKLEVSFVDPDKNPAEFFALAQRYWIDAEKEEGRIVASVAAVVVRGDRRQILRHHDLVEVDAEDDLRRRPRIEQALTGAIRGVLGRERPKVCFSSGHGESGSEALREHLGRSGFDTVSIEPMRAPNPTPLDGCAVLVIAGPTERVAADDTARFKAYFEKGGSVLVAVGPQPESERYSDRGLGDVLAVGGLKLDEDFVFELDPKRRSARGNGETFVPIARAHAATRALLRAEERGLSAVVTVASSLSPTGAGSAATSPLLATSDAAFGMVDFFAWAKSGGPPLPAAADKKGPLAIAYAAELPKPADKPRGARLVAVGTAGVMMSANWQSDELRGTALFVESAIAWLAAEPPILDIPPKPAYSAGLRVSEDWIGAAFRYVVAYMPLASILLGVAVYLRRRSTEQRKDATDA